MNRFPTVPAKLHKRAPRRCSRPGHADDVKSGVGAAAADLEKALGEWFEK